MNEPSWKWIPQPWSSLWITAAPANILPTTSWEIPNQLSCLWIPHSQKLCERINASSCFKMLSFGVNCYVALENQYSQVSIQNPVLREPLFIIFSGSINSKKKKLHVNRCHRHVLGFNDSWAFELLSCLWSLYLLSLISFHFRSRKCKFLWQQLVKCPGHDLSGVSVHSISSIISSGDYYGSAGVVAVPFFIGLVCSCSFSSTGFPATEILRATQYFLINSFCA